jgi:hypothetical protein
MNLDLSFVDPYVGVRPAVPLDFKNRFPVLLPRPSAIPLTSQIRFIAKIILWQS